MDILHARYQKRKIPPAPVLRGLSVNNYDFPSLQAYDNFISEKWFVRGKLNLEAEALAQLKAALGS